MISLFDGMTTPNIIAFCIMFFLSIICWPLVVCSFKNFEKKPKSEFWKTIYICSALSVIFCITWIPVLGWLFDVK